MITISMMTRNNHRNTVVKIGQKNLLLWGGETLGVCVYEYI